MAASILGYKPATLVEDHIVSQLKCTNMMRAFIQANPYCARIHHQDYIFYTQDTRKHALLLIYALNTKWEDFAHDIEYHCLLGKLFGYREDDIKLFIQNRFFEREQPPHARKPHNFTQFINTTWNTQYKETYQRISQEVDQYIANTSEYEAERKLQDVHAHFTYDVSSHTIIAECATYQLQLLYHYIYALKNELSPV